MDKLIRNIEHWAEDRNLISGSTPHRQLLKLYEEFGELCSGLAKNKPEVIKDSVGDCFVVLVILNKQLNLGDNIIVNNLETPFYEYTDIPLGVMFYMGGLAALLNGINKPGLKQSTLRNALKDHIAWCIHGLTFLCDNLGLEFKDCVQYAYDQIKDQKGKMVDGVFIKETDL